MRNIQWLLAAGLSTALVHQIACTPQAVTPVTGADVSAGVSALTETDFANNPSLRAKLSQQVIVRLEAAGGHEGDTGKSDGVDEIPYVLTAPTTLALGVPESEQHPHSIELFDASGKRLLFARQKQASSRVRLSAGRYTIRLRHGGGSAPARHTLMLTAQADSAKSGAAQNRRPDFEDPGDLFCDVNGDTGFGNVEGEYDSVTVWLHGNMSCQTFSGLNFSDYYYNRFAGVWLISFSSAHNATFTNCTFASAAVAGELSDSTFTSCTFTNVDWDFFKLTGNSTFSKCNMTNRVDLNLTIAAKVDQCDFSNTNIKACNLTAATVTNCNFTNANFDGAILDGNVAMFRPEAKNVFTGAKFAGVSVKNIDFSGNSISLKTLGGTDWSRANFGGANISGQDLTGFSFSGASFVGTNMTGVISPNNATFKGNNFTSATLENANVSGGDFTGATFEQASAVAANFAGSVMDSIDGHGASFTYANLSSCSFAAAQLGGAAGSGLDPANFAHAYMPNAKLTDNADCRNVDFSHAHLYGHDASVQSAELTAADFTDAVISGMDFSGATLESVTFEGAQAVATKFVSAKLTDAKFDDAYLLGADFTNATATGASFINAAVSTAPCAPAGSCSSCDSDPTCKFSDLNQAQLCCYSFTEVDATGYSVAFDATQLPTDPSIFCPNGEHGPCTGTKLKPRDDGPFPVVPACVPSPFTWCDPPTQ